MDVDLVFEKIREDEEENDVILSSSSQVEDGDGILGRRLPEIWYVGGQTEAVT